MLMQNDHVAPEYITRLNIAGGLGGQLNLCNAARVGLFPKELLGVARSVGNVAIEGAGLVLVSSNVRQRLLDIATEVS